MKLRLSTALLTLALVMPRQTMAQEHEMTTADAARITPMAPTNVKADRRENGEVRITWKIIPLEKIVSYKIYRKAHDQEAFTWIATMWVSGVKRVYFTDGYAPKGELDYAVASVDYFKNESPFSKTSSVK